MVISSTNGYKTKKLCPLLPYVGVKNFFFSLLQHEKIFSIFKIKYFKFKPLVNKLGNFQKGFQPYHLKTHKN